MLLVSSLSILEKDVLNLILSLNSLTLLMDLRHVIVSFLLCYHSSEIRVKFSLLLLKKPLINICSLRKSLFILRHFLSLTYLLRLLTDDRLEGVRGILVVPHCALHYFFHPPVLEVDLVFDKLGRGALGSDCGSPF